MFKKKRFRAKVLKNTFTLLVCVMFIFVSSFSVYAEQLSKTLRVTYYWNDSFSSPVVSVSASASPISSKDVYSYTGEVTVQYMILTTDSSSCLIQGLIYIGNDISLTYSPLQTGTSSQVDLYNPIIISLQEATLYDVYGVSYPVYSMSSFIYFNDVYRSGSSNKTSVPHSSVLYFRANELPLGHYCILRATYSVYSQCPPVYCTFGTPSLVSPTSVSFWSSDYIQSLPRSLYTINRSILSLGSQSQDINNKLQNLTDGYDNTAINNSNTALNNSLTAYDRQEDEAISAATDFFTEIKTPISFFDSGTFIAASSFVWTWLQGVYEHLGQAQVVVDVFLALTVAFTFVGLSRYIFRHSGRSSGGSEGG